MKKKIQQGARQKGKMRTRLITVIAVFTFFLTIAGSLLVFLNLNNLSKMRASGTGQEGGGNNLNNGEIICEFTWDSDSVMKANLGPDAMKCSRDAHIMQGGRNGTMGISPGKNGKDIDLEIKATEIFNLDGIDISIDYRRNEESCNFYSRGSGFRFGIEKGFLASTFTIENKMGKQVTIHEVSSYEVPMDPVFRNYRFIYNPAKGKAEMFVNNLVVWQHETERSSPLAWKNNENIVIGEGMNGGEVDRVAIDNLVIRSTGSVLPLAESLLNFMLEAKDGFVRINWSTSANEKVENFTIERSTNGKDFANLVNVTATTETGEEVPYTYTDKNSVSTPIVYYRLRQTFKNGKFVTHPLSAIRFRSDKGFAIENINPSPFKNTCDIAYFMPKSGRVWLQIINENGNIVNTESFEAPQGKNVHVLKDDKNLISGTYTVALIFDNMKVTSKLVKI
jgi:hypothetical protein